MEVMPVPVEVRAMYCKGSLVRRASSNRPSRLVSLTTKEFLRSMCRRPASVVVLSLKTMRP